MMIYEAALKMTNDDENDEEKKREENQVEFSSFFL